MNRRVALISGIGAAVAIAGVAVAIWLTAGRQPADIPAGASSTPTATTTPASSPTPVPTPAPTTSPSEVGGDATALVTPFLAAENSLRENPATPAQLDAIATGLALQDLRVSATELSEDGMSQVGAPVVVDASVTEIDEAASPATMSAIVCLDYTDVDVRSSDGQSVKDAGAPMRVPTLLRFVQVDGSWLVTERTFPDDPSC